MPGRGRAEGRGGNSVGCMATLPSNVCGGGGFKVALNSASICVYADDQFMISVNCNSCQGPLIQILAGTAYDRSSYMGGGRPTRCGQNIEKCPTI